MKDHVLEVISAWSEKIICNAMSHANKTVFAIDETIEVRKKYIQCYESCK